MSDIAINPRGVARSDLFRMRTVALMLVIGIMGFVGTLVIGAFAPDLRSGRNGGAHALSNAAVGFSGIVQLAEATGHNPQIVRSEHLFGSDGLLVATPDRGFDDISAILAARSDKPTLFVLPKWVTVSDPKHQGWVRIAGLVFKMDPASLFAPKTTLGIRREVSHGAPLLPAGGFDPNIRFVAPRVLQVVTGVASNEDQDQNQGAKRETDKPLQFVPLLTDGRGGAVLARIGDGPLYVLADPDLLSNAGIKDVRQAAAALAMLDWINRGGAKPINFDVTLNGLGHSQSPLKLAFTPPFLAMTLALAAVLLLVGWHALGRFGPIRPRERAIAFGKAALVENSAKLIRRARRETSLGGRYAQVIRERAVATFGVPARLKDAALDAYLDRLGTWRGHRFSELARTAENTQDRDQLVAAAQALHQWQKEKRA
jgi:hypothetical protein